MKNMIFYISGNFFSHISHVVFFDICGKQNYIKFCSNFFYTCRPGWPFLHLSLIFTYMTTTISHNMCQVLHLWEFLHLITFN